MSRACDVIFLGAATAFPNAGTPGNILVGQAGAIDGAVAIVADDGAPVAIEATPYVPTNDNLTDLGTTAARFRTLYLGTSLLLGASATAQSAALTQPAVNQALLTAEAGAAGLKFVGSGIADVNGVQVTASATTVAPIVEAYGADTNLGLTVRQKGTGGLVLGTTTGTLAFYGATPVAKAAAVTVPTDLPTCITAVTALIAALKTTGGVGLLAG